MHSDWSITQNVNKRADWLTLFALVPRATTFNPPNTILVTLAPGLRPERRFAPLARG